MKERCRCVYADMPVTYLHKQIVIHMVYFAQTMMNAFPAAKGILERFSLRGIALGRSLDAERDLKARFGDYVEASVDADVTNDIKGRTHPCIALGPTRNWQGSVKCFDLGTGKVVVRRTIKVLPMPDRVVKSLNAWGKSPKNLAYENKLEFLNRHKQKYDWDNKELDIDEGKVEPDEPVAHPSIPAGSQE